MTKAMRIAAVLMVVVLLAAALTPAAQAQEKIKLTLLGWSGSEAENKALTAVVDAFNKSQNEIEATFNGVPEYDQVLQNALVGGTPPDVFYVSVERFPDFVRDGVLMPIGDQIENIDDIFPSLRDTFTADGKLYCPAKDFSTLALQINTEMFEKAGLKPPTNWDELMAAAKALTTDTVAGIVLPPVFDRFGAFLYSGGAEITDPEFTKMLINSPEALTALNFYAGLYTAGYAKTAQDLGAGWPGEAFGKGQAAMAFEGNWIVGYLKDQFPDLKYQTVEIPAGPTGKRATLAFTVCYGVPAKAANPEASIKFVNYLVGPEGMKLWTGETGILPSRQSLVEEFVKNYPDREVYVKSAEFARGWRFVSGWSDVQNKANEQIQLLFAGQTTAEDALKAIEKVGNEVLAKTKR